MRDETPVKVALATRPLSVLQTLRVARRNLLEIIPRIATTQPMVSGRTGIRWHMVMDPDALRRILRDRVEAYPKADNVKRILRPAIGDSLFIAEGAHWRWQRQAAAPVFRLRNIRNLGPVMSEAADHVSARLSAADGKTVDVFSETVATTFEVIANVTFSAEGEMHPEAVQKAIEAYIASTAKLSLLDIIGAPDWIPRPGRLFRPAPLKRMQRLADRAIARRRETGPKPVPDLLDLLLEAEDSESGRRMNAQELRDNLLTFIVAGHETTALALAWSLYLLAFDPAVQERARSEALAVLGGRTATAEDCPNLIYIRQVLEEALRLYPPAAFLSRTALEADRLCDREVRAGETVMIPVYALHRSRVLWKDPDHFDPDRFAPGAEVDRFQFLPFGDGPRICIGAQFAIQEAQIVLATLLARFRFHATPETAPRPELLLTLRPAGGVRLRIEQL